MRKRKVKGICDGVWQRLEKLCEETGVEMSDSAMAAFVLGVKLTLKELGYEVP